MSLPWESVATGGKRIAAPVCGLARNDRARCKIPSILPAHPAGIVRNYTFSGNYRTIASFFNFPPAHPIFVYGASPPETVEKVVERRDTGRKIVTKETQEGCLSFLIIRFWNFFKVSKSSPACRKDFFDKLRGLRPL